MSKKEKENHDQFSSQINLVYINKPLHPEEPIEDSDLIANDTDILFDEETYEPPPFEMPEPGEGP